jgi:RimJ/RimL family protein N-acetyltransferase
MPANACGFWDNDGCEGTVDCPPRCPRFVDREGTQYLVTPVGDDDLDAAVTMYEDFAPEHRSMDVPPTETGEIRSWLERLHERGRHFLAWDGDRVVGHSGYSPSHRPEPEFLVFVHQDYHGRGLGTELTRHAIAYAAEDGHDALVLHVDGDNAAAVRVYEKLGFRTVARHALELEMRLPFTAPIAEEVRLPPAMQA